MNEEIATLASLHGKRVGGYLVEYTKFHTGNGNFILCGQLLNDTMWSDGEIIRTSRVITINETEKYVETKHTYYMLGTEVTNNSHKRQRLLSAL